MNYWNGMGRNKWDDVKDAWHDWWPVLLIIVGMLLVLNWLASGVPICLVP